MKTKNSPFSPHARHARGAAIRLIAALSLAFPAGVRSAETTSAPVGEYHVPVPVGTSAWVYGLVAEDMWTGQIEAVTPYMELAPGRMTTFLNLDSTAAFDNQVLQARPHYLEVLDGPWAGLILDTMEGAGTQITVWGDGGPAGFDLQPGTTVAVRAHATLGTMFPGESSGFVAGADLIMVATPVDDGYGGVTQVERVFMHNGLNWEDGASLEPGDDVVVYPGQGFLVTIGSDSTDGPRHLAFGAGPVCHVKATPTLIPLTPCWSAVQLMGPVWPVEMDAAGAFRTVGVLDIGLFQAMEPWSDLAVTFSSNGLLQDLALMGSDGVELLNAMSWQPGSVTAADRFVKGSALYIMACSPHYWVTEGVK